MTYRISFVYVAGSDNRIHVVRKMGEFPVCGTVPISFHKLFNFDEIRRSSFCSKCQDFYICRSEKEFAVINDKSSS